MLQAFKRHVCSNQGFSSFEGWWILSASSTAEGVGGAQIWINPCNNGLSWDRRALSILHAAPQCLIVLARVNGLDGGDCFGTCAAFG